MEIFSWTLQMIGGKSTRSEFYGLAVQKPLMMEVWTQEEDDGANEFRSTLPGGGGSLEMTRAPSARHQRSVWFHALVLRQGSPRLTIQPHLTAYLKSNSLAIMNSEDDPLVEDVEDISPIANAIESGDEEDDIEDETLTERLIGLTEMFPNWLCSGSVSLVCNTRSALEKGFSFSRAAVWFLASTAVVLVMPVILEIERSGVEEQQKQQQRQILLGPGAVAMNPGPAGGMSLPPPPPSMR